MLMQFGVIYVVKSYIYVEMNKMYSEPTLFILDITYHKYHMFSLYICSIFSEKFENVRMFTKNVYDCSKLNKVCTIKMFRNMNAHV